MFFHTNDIDLYAVGTQDKRNIPLEACRSAIIVDVNKVSLHNHIHHPGRPAPP